MEHSVIYVMFAHTQNLISQIPFVNRNTKDNTKIELNTEVLILFFVKVLINNSKDKKKHVMEKRLLKNGILLQPKA
jgi:hypothetical protein